MALEIPLTDVALLSVHVHSEICIHRSVYFNALSSSCFAILYVSIVRLAVQLTVRYSSLSVYL